MRFFKLSFLFLLFIYSVTSIAQDLKWIKKDAIRRVITLTNDNDGNIFASGYSNSSEGSDLFITKYDSSGNILWTRIMGHSMYGGEHNVTDIKTDAEGNCYASGTLPDGGSSDNVIEGTVLLSKHFYIVKYDPSGIPLWVRGYGTVSIDDRFYTNPCTSNSMEIKGSSIYITGGLSCTTDIEGFTLSFTSSTSSNLDMMLCKMDTSGSVQWAKKYGSVGAVEEGLDIAVDKNENIYVTGQGIICLKYSSDGTLLHKLTGITGPLYSKGIGVDGNGNIYHFSFFVKSTQIGDSIITVEKNGICLLKYNKDFQLQWIRHTTSGYIWWLSDAMETDDLGNTYLAGDADYLTFQNNANIIDEGLFIAKYNSAGVLQGLNNIITNDGHTYDISVGPHGRYYLGGDITTGLSYIAAYKDTLKNTSPGWIGLNNLHAGEVTATSVELLWNDLTDSETGFEIERSYFKDKNFKTIATTAANVTSFIDNKNLIDQYQYYYRVKAFNGDGYSKNSNVVGVKTLLALPRVPTFTGATRWDDNVMVYWMADPKATGFILEVSKGSDPYVLIDTLTQTSFTFTSATPNTLYHFRLSAYNSIGTSGYSTIKYTGHLNIPLTPTDISATAVSSGINIQWTDTSNGEEGFYILKALNSGDQFFIVDTVATNSNSVIISNLEGNTTYYFKVQAYNDILASNYSNYAFAKTFPAAPAGLEGPEKVTNSSTEVEFKITPIEGLNYQWSIMPADAGTISSNEEDKINITWNPTFTGTAEVNVTASNSSGVSKPSKMFVQVFQSLTKPSTPSGDVIICDKSDNTSYHTNDVNGADYYTWVLVPEDAGQIIGDASTISVNWLDSFSGAVKLIATAQNSISNASSDTLSIQVGICTNVTETNVTEEYQQIYPNPSKGVFTIDVGNKFLQGSTYEILNSIGKVIRSGYLSEQLNVIDLGPISGLYIIKTNITKTNNIYRLVIE